LLGKIQAASDAGCGFSGLAKLELELCPAQAFAFPEMTWYDVQRRIRARQSPKTLEVG
jgi:hypothetical protein